MSIKVPTKGTVTAAEFDATRAVPKKAEKGGQVAVSKTMEKTVISRGTPNSTFTDPSKHKYANPKKK